MPYQTKSTLKIFWHHAWRYKFHLILLCVVIFIVEALQTYTPLYYRDLFNLLYQGTGETVYKQALSLVLVIFILNLLRTTLWRVHNFINNFFQPKVMADLTNTCYKYLHKHSVTFFSNSFVGSLVTKVKRYERSFEVIADQVYYELGRSVLDAGLVLVVLFWQYPKFGLLTFLWCICYFLFSYYFSLYKLPWDIKRAGADTKTTGQLADSITNNANIKLFTSYEKENERFANVTEEQRKLRKKSWDLGTIGDIFQSTAMISLEFAIVYWAVVLWQQGLMQVGDIVLLQTYVYRISDKLWNTGKNMRAIYEALADANEMTEMLNLPHEVQDRSDKQIKVSAGAIEFKNVLFQYQNGNKIFDAFNLKIKSKEKVALIGPSGGGKTTLTKLIMRFVDIQAGEITIDKQNIALVKQDSLREKISFVPQEPVLFHRSLMENIRYANSEATDEEIISAAKLAHAHEFISKFPDKYKTLVGERGIKLSGGERQRVAIARAILKDAPILILDEATSSLDSESESYIQDALKVLMKGKTVIVIAHRLSTIMQMDRIVVIEKGRITEEGKHEELVKAQKGTYQRLWQIQAGGFTN